MQCCANSPGTDYAAQPGMDELEPTPQEALLIGIGRALNPIGFDAQRFIRRARGLEGPADERTGPLDIRQRTGKRADRLSSAGPGLLRHRRKSQRG